MNDGGTILLELTRKFGQIRVHPQPGDDRILDDLFARVRALPEGTTRDVLMQEHMLAAQALTDRSVNKIAA